MPKPVYSSDQIMQELQIKKARLSQLVNGYTNSKGVKVPAILKEGDDFYYERVKVQGPKRAVTMHKLQITEEGRAKLNALPRKIGRPEKKTK